MNNLLYINESFTRSIALACSHMARAGKTFLSHFILYPLRATSATRGTLGAIASLIKRKKFMKILFLSIFVIALNDGYSQEKNLIVDFSTGAGFVCWQSIVTKDYYQIGDKKSISKSYLGYNLPFKIGLLIKNNKYSYGFGFSYESLGIKDIEKDNNASHYTITKIFLQGEYLFKDHDKYSYGINMQLGKFFNDDISLGNYEYFISTGLIIQYPLKDKYIIYFKPEYELKYYNVNFEGREPWPSTYYVKIDGNHFIHHVNANIGFRFII